MTNKTWKRILCLLICVAMIFVVLPQGITISAESYSGSCGDNLTWSLDVDTGLLTITGTGKMNDYSYYYNVPWYSYRSYIKTVEIEDGVTSIGSSAFHGCTELTNIAIPDSVTSIGGYAFVYCTGLASITIPGSVTNAGFAAFYRCTKLKKIYYTGSISDWCESFSHEYIFWSDGFPESPEKYAYDLYINNELINDLVIPDTVKTIGAGAFYACKSIESITIPDSINSIGYEAFSGCTELKKINYNGSIADWCNIQFDNQYSVGSYIIDYSHDFYIKNELVTDLVIPDSVSEIKQYAFCYCSSIKSIVIPDSVTEIGYDAFYNCTGLASAAIGDCVSEIRDGAFYGCQSLNSITIPDSVTKIGYDTFYRCSKLGSVTIGNSLNEIGAYAFYGCGALKTVNYTGGVAEWCKITFGDSTANPLAGAQSMYIDDKLVADLVIPNNITTINSSAFYGYAGLVSVTISNSVTKIGEDAFYNCGNLISITIPDSVESVGYRAFSGTGYYQDESNWENGVLYIGKHLYATNRNTVSGEYVINDGTKTILKNAFYYCHNLTSIVIPDSVTEIGEDAFYDCSNLMSITIPDSVVLIGRPFSGCNIKNVIIANGSKSVEIVKKVSASNTLESVTIHNSVTSIGSSTLSNFVLLTSITIPDSVTEIGDSAFYGCRNLRTIVIPASVAKIDYAAFGYCASLTDVYYTGTEQQRDGILIGDHNNYLENATWHYNYVPGLTNCTHSYEAEITYPTCTEQGYTTYTCSNCGHSYTTYTEPTGHTLSDWIIDTEPQIGVDGSRHRECTMCGQILETGIVPPTLQNPVVSISVNDCYTVKSNVIYTSGNSNNSYDLYNFNLGFNVRYSNQIEESFNGNGFWKDGYYYDLQITCDVPYEEWEVGNSYTCTATLLGVSDTFSITLEEIESVSVTPKECIKNMSGYYDGFWDDENQTWVYDSWFRYSIEPDEITVTMKDEMTFTGTYWEICEQLGVGHSITADQSYDNPWDIGEHKATMFIGNYETEYTVNVVGGPIARIEIGDMEITEFTHGYYSDNGNYIYNQLLNGLTIVMNDGSRIESNNEWVEINGSSYSLNIDSSDQYNEQWSAGNTYEVTASLLGVSCTFNVTIKESPIASIQMDDIEIIEYTHGDWKNDRYIYNWHPLSGKAVMKDGSECILKFDGSGSYYDDGRVYRGFEVDGQKYSMFIDLSSQYEESWTAGNTYQINCQALGISDSFNIAITESPIASAVIDDLTLIQGMDSDKNGSSDYYYINPTYTVTFKDGTQKTFENGEGVYVGGFYSNLDIDVDQSQSPFEPGKTYELTGRIGPASNTFTLTIVENPVDWIEVLKNPDKTEYYDFEYFDLKGLSLRVHYKDGQYEDFTVKSSGSTVMDYSFFSEKYQRKDSIWSYEIYPVGQTTISMDLFGKEFEISINVIENPIVALSVKENENKSPVLTVTKNDATKEDWKILAISYLDRSHDGYITAHQINTDHGFFDMMLRQDENGYVIALNTSDNQVIESNILEKSEWLEVATLLPNGIQEKGYDWLSDAKKEHFLGSLTAGNIDDTIRFVFESSLMSYWEYAIKTGERVDEDGNYEAYYIYTGDYVRQVLLKYLALDEIDLSLSNYYDSQNDTYRLVCSLGGGEFTPSRLEYRNGIWTAEYHAYWWDEPLTTYYCLNDEHKVIKIDNKDTLYGDLNGDGKINGKDGILCSQALAGWDVVYSELAADVNGDGKFNGKDGILLSQYLAGWDVVLG